MKKVTVIPLDSRPCNTTWLEKLSRDIVNLVIYPQKLCGNLLVGANIDQMINWLDKEIEDTDYLIISADGLCSGGLVQARLGKINVEEVIEKLSVLKTYKKNNPHLKIYLFDTIMRTSITAYDEESEFYWGKMNEYSKMLGRIYFFNQEEDKQKLKELEDEIPSRIIETYKSARRVKHVLNKYFIDQTNEELIDYMILLQEDSMPYGVQKIEQIELVNLINKYNIEDKVKFYNGTDEGAVVLLGKIFTEGLKTPKVYLHLPYSKAIDKVFPFEDQMFIDNLNKMFETVGFNYTNNASEADFILSIYTEDNDYNLEISSTKEIKPNKDETYQKYISELNSFINSNKNVAFVDLLFPNGGSYELLKDINYQGLKVYSAWNTASNSMGSALCEMTSFMVSPTRKDTFKYERIIDDCIYQYIVRRKVNEKFLKLGYNIHNLETEKAQEVLKEIYKEIKMYTPFIGDFKYKIVLPWNRTFEIDIDIEE